MNVPETVLPSNIPDFTATLCSGAEAMRALTDGQLSRIRLHEPKLHAFVAVEQESRVATMLDEALVGSKPLAGALVAVKDIYDTIDLPTTYGSTLQPRSKPCRDAWCVRAIRAGGGVIIGKTVTTEFGFAQCGPTRNPWDLERTPGGSSSGSAAAIAAGFASFALGTQTGGSTIRPASYTGITGYKPTYGLLPTDGIHPASTTLEHVGMFARSCRDLWLLTAALLTTRLDVLKPERPQCVIILRLSDTIDLSRAAMSLVERAASELGRHCRVEELALPFPVEDFLHLQETICYWEAARLFLAAGEYRLSDELHELLASYLETPIEVYFEARSRRDRHAEMLSRMLSENALIMLPAATGVAPLGLTSTGDASLNRFWTAMHGPCVSLPVGWTNGLPIGLQLVGRQGSDRQLLAQGQWLQSALGRLEI